MATLYDEIPETLYSRRGFGDAIPGLASLPYSSEMAYTSYVKWEDGGGVDLQLPAFKLTNRQMFWVCYAHTAAEKYQKLKTEQGTPEYEEYNKRLHSRMIHLPGFREAFKCGGEFESFKKTGTSEFIIRMVAYMQRHSLI